MRIWRSMTEKERYDKDLIVALARQAIQRLWIICLVLIVYAGVMTYLYITERTSYETVKSEIEMDAKDGNIDHVQVAGVGDIYYGEDTSDGDETSEEVGR